MTRTLDERALAERLLDDGCVIVPDVIDAARVARLRELLEDVRLRWLARDPLTGAPGGSADDAVCMRHVAHPAYFADRRERLPEILDACAEARVLAVLRAGWGEEPMLRSTSLFFSPGTATHDGAWHRDTQFSHPDADEERALLARLATRVGVGAQVQIALVASDDLEYVTGSHRRWDSDEELRVRRGGGDAREALPGARRLALAPGDAAIFMATGLHRGRYHADKPRRSLMLTYTRSSVAPHLDRFSWQPWCLEPGYLDGVAPATRTLLERFIAHYRAAWLDPRADPGPLHSGL